MGGSGGGGYQQDNSAMIIAEMQRQQAAAAADRAKRLASAVQRQTVLWQMQRHLFTRAEKQQP